ncbi:hypothetical protein ACTL32_04270 [Planococcus sp. FY231025]|uniref:hypothetical protein n=1 Tax=Planococcus sp. FY231025 TaxID=3455699 RepID=UPI003F91A5B2
MKYLKFFLGQSALFAMILPFISLFDSLINPPLTWKDLLFGALSIPFQYLAWKAMEGLGAYFNEIHLALRILLSVPAFVLSALLVGSIGYAVFQIQ